tara:strand:+ start:797 stop:1642 length:846 start_codon:yes stop_codon:yes gene_type:complete
MKINSIVLIILSTIVFYILLTKKENMSNTDIKKIISEIYQADIQSIRNLSKLANDLTNTGKLVVPGGLEIKGNLKINGNVGVRRDPHPKVGLIVNGKGLTWGLETTNSGIESSGKIKGGSLQIENNSMFGTKSGRPLSITSSNYKNEQTYIGFYNGSTRTNYLLPRTDGTLYNLKNFSSNGIKSRGHLGADGEIAAKKGLYANCKIIKKNGYGSSCSQAIYNTNIKSHVKSSLKNITFKYKSGSSGIVWTEHRNLRGTDNEKGLAARPRHSGDWFTFSQIK